MLVLSRRLREGQGMDRSYLVSRGFFLLPIIIFFFLGGGGGGGVSISLCIL